MAFIRTRTIKGRQYRYLEERWREGKKVRSRSIFLGAVGAVAGFIGGNLRVEPGTRALEKCIEEGERNKELALAKQAQATAMAEKTVPTEMVGTKEASEPIQPSSETAQHSPGSDESASAASPR